MSKPKNIIASLSAAKRVGLHVSIEAMKELGWSKNPILLLESFKQLTWATKGNLSVKFEAEFPIWLSRLITYKVEVVVKKKDVKSRWEIGSIKATHPTANVVGTAKFRIIWDGEIPTVEISEFKLEKQDN